MCFRCSLYIFYLHLQLFKLPYTAWKLSKYGVFSGPQFLVFGLKTEIYFVNLRIQSKYRKIRTRRNSLFEHFSRGVFYTPLFVHFSHLLMFSLYYYTNLTKSIKYRKLEITTKFSRLKSVSSIDDDYLQTTAGGVL